MRAETQRNETHGDLASFNVNRLQNVSTADGRLALELFCNVRTSGVLVEQRTISELLIN